MLRGGTGVMVQVCVGWIGEAREYEKLELLWGRRKLWDGEGGGARFT